MWGNTASGSTKYSGPQPGPTSAVARASQSNSSQKKPQQVLLGTVSAVWSDQAAEGIFQVGFENLQWCRWHSFCSTAGLSMQGKRFFPTFILFPSRVLLYAHCLSPSCDPPLRTAWLCFLDNLIKVIVEAVARSCTIKIIPPTDQISPAHWTTSQEVLQPQGHPDSPVLCVLLISHFFPRGRWGKDKNRTQHLNAFNKVANRSWQTLCFPPPPAFWLHYYLYQALIAAPFDSPCCQSRLQAYAPASVSQGALGLLRRAGPQFPDHPSASFESEDLLLLVTRDLCWSPWPFKDYRKQSFCDIGQLAQHLWVQPVRSHGLLCTEHAFPVSLLTFCWSFLPSLNSDTNWRSWTGLVWKSTSALLVSAATNLPVTFNVPTPSSLTLLLRK